MKIHLSNVNKLCLYTLVNNLYELVANRGQFRSYTWKLHKSEGEFRLYRRKIHSFTSNGILSYSGCHWLTIFFLSISISVLRPDNVNRNAELDFVLDFNFGNSGQSITGNNYCSDNHFTKSIDGGSTAHGFLCYGHRHMGKYSSRNSVILFNFRCLCAWRMSSLPLLNMPSRILSKNQKLIDLRDEFSRFHFRCSGIRSKYSHSSDLDTW